MFGPRLLSGIVLMIIMFCTFFFGSPVLTLLLFAVSLIGYRELCKVIGITGKDGAKIAAPEVVGYIGTTAFYGLLLLFNLDVLSGDKFLYLTAVVAFTFLAQLFVYVFAFPKISAEEVGFSVFAFLYCPVMLSFIDMTRAMENGKLLVWLILICSWGCDTCAYCVGVLIGKKKVFPVLSPKKSLEGCIGGVVGAMLIGVLYAKFAMNYAWTDAGILAVVCAFGALASMVGDLAASAIKRNKGIKDYGKLIPGHGGIMDRFDSVIVTAPMVFFLVAILL